MNYARINTGVVHERLVVDVQRALARRQRHVTESNIYPAVGNNSPGVVLMLEPVTVYQAGAGSYLYRRSAIQFRHVEITQSRRSNIHTGCGYIPEPAGSRVQYPAHSERAVRNRLGYLKEHAENPASAGHRENVRDPSPVELHIRPLTPPFIHSPLVMP